MRDGESFSLEIVRVMNPHHMCIKLTNPYTYPENRTRVVDEDPIEANLNTKKALLSIVYYVDEDSRPSYREYGSN